LSLTLFEKMPVNEALSNQHYSSEHERSRNQLILI
jgi:hypothetical protein